MNILTLLVESDGLLTNDLRYFNGNAMTLGVLTD